MIFHEPEERQSLEAVTVEPIFFSLSCSRRVQVFNYLLNSPTLRCLSLAMATFREDEDPAAYSDGYGNAGYIIKEQEKWLPIANGKLKRSVQGGGGTCAIVEELWGVGEWW